MVDLIFYGQWITCKIDHKMDQSLWQTIIPFDLLHSSYMWIETVLLCGKHCQTMGLFQDSDLAGDLEDSKSTSGGTLCTFGSHTFVPISWMCKKQTSVSHSSTESEVISLDAGLRLDGISPHLIYGIWSSQFLETRIRVIKKGETRWWTNVKLVQHLTQFKNENNLKEWSMIWTMLILFFQTSTLLIRKLCCMCLKTTKQWSRWW